MVKSILGRMSDLFYAYPVEVVAGLGVLFICAVTGVLWVIATLS